MFFTTQGFSQSPQTGEITGNINDSTEAIIGALVVVEGNNSLGAVTDVDGNFTIKNVTPGTYNLSVSYFGYKNTTVKDVVVTAGKTTNVNNIVMPEDVLTSQEIVVVGTKTTNTEAAAVKETKESKQVVNVISSEQISKSQDRDAAQVMQRVPGVTIIDNRFVMIRGLSERYNTVMINDAYAPNTEVERRSFSFDLIPSQMLDRVSVYKSGAADLPGDFAAGVIKIYTKNIPDENYTTFSMLGGYRTGTTFNNFTKSNTGSLDFLGFSDGSRSLPNSFPANLNDPGTDVIAASKSLPNTFGNTSGNALPDLRLNFDMGRRFTIGSIKVGNVTSVAYSNTYQYQNIDRHEYTNFDTLTQASGVRTHFIDNRSAQTARLGIIHNWSFILSSRSKLDFKNLFNQQGENETIIRNGTDDSRPSDSLRSYSYRYSARSIYSGQLSGKHEFKNDKTSFFWNVGYSYISRTIPDWRRFRTYKEIGTDNPYTMILPPNATTFESARFYSDLKETSMMTSGALEHKFVKNADSTGISLKAGYYLESRSREFSARWLSYKAINGSAATDSLASLPIDQVFASNNIGGHNGFKLAEGTNPSDKYSASSQIYAGFAAITIPVKSLTIQTGLRVEAYRQYLASATFAGPVKVDTTIVSPLPFLNLSYNFTKKTLLRLAYSRTINRAEFRELAPFLFYDFDLNANFSGNPNLKPCNIDNVDLRWELYPSSSEMISFGVFYKHFTNPIEVITASSNSPRQFGFNNADYANNVGIEAEVRKSFDNVFQNKFLQRFSLLFNASLIQSKVDLGKTLTEKSSRPLQGQSPYVINAGIYYNHPEKGLMVSVMYNVFGQRIFIVGDNYNGNIYEMPRHIVDLTIQKKLTKHLEGRVGVQNLLNWKTRFIQDSNQDNKITGVDEPFITTNLGAYINIGFVYKF